MTTTQTNRLADLLQESGVLNEAQVKDILAMHHQSSKSLTEIVVEAGFVSEQEYLEALAGVLGVPYLRVGNDTIDPEILNAVPTKAVFQYNVIPIEKQNGTLRIVTNDPFRPGLVDALKLATGSRIRLALSPSSDIDKAAKDFYGVGADTVEAMMQDDRMDLSIDEGILKQDLSALDSDASVVKFVNQIIAEAYKNRATDIHLEPMEESLRIRYRIDGVLHPAPLPPQLKRFQSAIISRIKVMGHMDISEKRLPQDGRISVRVAGEEIDVRVSTMPTVYGESVSLRLLTRNVALLGLQKLGLNARDEAVLEKLIHKPHGIILVTGPTGSGKSTSLYAYLHTINSVDKRIITTEDPIEYEMTGVNQVQMKPEIGLTFAVGLRHILRQDPDVIMVGEIRDRETADIAIRASLTGHLVFSTLHTNDAAGAVTRLIDMGIEPFLVASSIEGLVAQRLVRRLCKECKAPRELDMAFLEKIAFPVDRLAEGTIYEPVGCEACRKTGYSGRMGLYEVIIVNEALRPLIIQRASSASIKNEAMRHGMRTLRDDGWDKVLFGDTTIEEILRVSEEDEEIS